MTVISNGPIRGLAGLVLPIAIATFGIGPQIGFLSPFADMQGYLNLKGYYEFDAENRLRDGMPG